MERRKARREKIIVDIEIARPGVGRCYGYAQNISRRGVSMVLQQGELPTEQRSVVLNFRIWTGSENLYRKVYARVVRMEGNDVALEFADNDVLAEAVVQDLLFYQRNSRKDRTGKLLRLNVNAPG